MIIWWLIILVIVGICKGFGEIDLLYWLLLIPFLMQDLYDLRRK